MSALDVFLLDERTGSPLIGVVVAISGDGRPLATLQSGMAGYLSFKLDREMSSAIKRLTLSQGSAELLAVDVGDLALAVSRLPAAAGAARATDRREAGGSEGGRSAISST